MPEKPKRPAISMAEVAGVFRQALKGDLPVRLKDKNEHWNSFVTICAFYFGGWEVAFFNDAGELDYTEWVIAPDGRKTEFDEWCDSDFVGCPLDELTPDEHEQMERLISSL